MTDHRLTQDGRHPSNESELFPLSIGRLTEFNAEDIACMLTKRPGKITNKQRMKKHNYIMRIAGTDRQLESRFAKNDNDDDQKT